jgi:hypothetical protein
VKGQNSHHSANSSHLFGGQGALIDEIHIFDLHKLEGGAGGRRGDLYAPFP